MKSEMRTILFMSLVIILISACNRNPKDDGSTPPPLYPQPQSVKLDTTEGYTNNQLTGEPIEPLVNSLGDTIPTGVPIKVEGKVIHPDSIAKPKVVKAGKGKVTNAHPNRHKVPDDLTTIPVNLDSLTKIPLEEIAEDDTSHYIVNSIGDTIPTGVPIPAEGKVVKAIQPKPIKALPPAFKDDAIANLQYLDVDQGMSSSYVLSILEDKNGNLWIATWGGGVSCYDGKTFTHFTKKEGLNSNYVRSILEDSKGNLWFGNDGGGVSFYDGENFTHFTVKEGLSNNTVRFILEDSKGSFWFGTNGGGVSCYDGENFTHFTVKEGLSSNYVRTIIEDNSGNIWFGTDGGGVNMFNGETFSHYTEKEGLSNNSVLSILEDQKGNLWFGTDGGGLSKYNGVSFVNFTKKEGLNNNTVEYIIEDKSGNIWFGTDGGGVCRYDGEIFSYYGKKEGLSNNTVFCILEGSMGELWFGTNGGGLIRYKEDSFIHFTKKEGLSNNTVFSILEDSKGNLWFATWGAGISCYDGERFIHFTKKEGLSNNYVMTITEDSKGNLLIGTWNGGVSCYNGESFSHYGEKEGLSNNTVFSILEDSKGNLWFATWGGGVSCFNGENFIHYTEKEGLSNNYIESIIEDNKGNLWFGTDQGGISTYNGETLIHYTEKEGISNNTVRSLLEDSRGDFWFGTDGGGLNRYDGESFSYYMEKEGLNINTVESIIEDNRGRLWLGTDRGITLIESYKEDELSSNVKPVEHKNKKSKSLIYRYLIKRLIKQDGLKGLDFFTNSAFIDSKNRAWWGTGKGLTMLDLNNFQLSQNPPKIYLKQLDINEQFIDYRNISDSLSNEIQFSDVERFENYPHELKLPYYKNHLTFHFVGIDWNAPHKIQYSHRMLGLNNNWSKPSHEAKADYRNLPYGTYIFQIRAIGESGEWSELFEYTFTIHPPWWHTWLARTLYVFFALTLILALFRWRTNKLKKRQIELESEVDLATKEIRQQKNEVEKQKEVVEKQKSEVESAHEELQEKNTEILDSITYAKRLQDAILPPIKLVKEYFEESFILFRPKDIVSGDFYWMETKENLIMFAAADCTGHGVPGAMVSVVCANSLNKSVNELGKTDPAEILNSTRELVIETFSKAGSDVKDGMDISLCVLNEGTETLHWAGANNPLWIVRRDQNEIEEIKADKQPIGLYGELKPFTSHSVKINGGDSIYMFSDGYADQFGGERGKKFKSGKFKKLLLEHRHQNMEQQKQALEKAFEDWKGSLEQIDDVCVIGVRLTEKEGNPFTRREMEIIQLLEQGKSSKMIADKLNISKTTVDTHRRRILKKVDAGNVTELLRICKDEKWM